MTRDRLMLLLVLACVAVMVLSWTSAGFGQVGFVHNEQFIVFAPDRPAAERVLRMAGEFRPAPATRTLVHVEWSPKPYGLIWLADLADRRQSLHNVWLGCRRGDWHALRRLLEHELCHAAGGTPTATQRTQSWDWSPKATHHRAAVQVRCVCGNGGSGVYVEHEGVEGVLTAAHVADCGEAVCTFADGTSERGSSTHDKFGYDAAFVFVEHDGIEPLQVASSPAKRGDRVEFITYGGPEDRLRHFWAATERDGEYDAYVASGDSGGGILNERHEVVGIQSTGDGPNVSRTWNVYPGANSATCGAIRAFMGRVAQRFGRCGPGGCGPQQPGGGMYPPVGPEPQPKPKPQPKPEPEPEPQACPADCDCRAALAELKARLAQLSERVASLEAAEKPLPLAPGPRGEPGECPIDEPLFVVRKIWMEAAGQNPDGSIRYEAGRIEEQPVYIRRNSPDTVQFRLFPPE